MKDGYVEQTDLARVDFPDPIELANASRVRIEALTCYCACHQDDWTRV